MTRPVDDSTVASLRTVLTQASRRAAVVASNLANIDTPDYRALDVRFDEVLEVARDVEIARTDPGHLAGAPGAGGSGRLEEVPAARVRNDGNSVDVDREMTLLAVLQSRYQGAAEMVRKRFALLIYAGTDGRNGG